jgi:hypothetical protein
VVAAHHFVKACVEILNGYRPAAHLRSLSQPREAASLISQALIAAQRIAASRRRTQPALRHRIPPPVVPVHTKVCEPCRGVVEAAAVLVAPERTWALALRLERPANRWLATVLRLL